MSLFEDKAVCERVNFYSHHIDPQIPNVSGVLSLANGHTSFAPVPDQTYTLTTVSSTDPTTNNHLQLVGQSGGPSPSVVALDIDPTGQISFPAGHLNVAAVPVVGETNQSTATITLLTDNSSNQFYKWYATNGDGGGLSDGHMQLFSYNNSSTPITQVIDIAGDGTVNFPVALQVQGQSVGNSSKSKQYIVSVASPPAPLYNTTTEYTFDISGCTGNYYAFTFSNITATISTAGSGVAYDIYLCDTLNGAYNAANGCIKLNTGVLTTGATYNSGPITLIYKNATAPTNLYLNVVQTNQAQQSGQLQNLAFNCEMISQAATVL